MNAHRQRSRLLPLVLLVANILLVAIILRELRAPDAEPLHSMAARHATGQPENLPAAPPPAGFALAPLAHFDEIVSRPLFEQSRRPLEPESEATNETAQTDSAPPGLTLVGIVLTEGESKALLKRRNSNEIVQATDGTRVDGWRVVEIQAQHIELSRGTDSVRLELERAPGKTADTRPPVRLPFTKPYRPR